MIVKLGIYQNLVKSKSLLSMLSIWENQQSEIFIWDLLCLIKTNKKAKLFAKKSYLVNIILSLNRKGIENGLMKQPWKGVLQVKLVAQIVIEFTDQFGNNWNKRKCSTRRVK